MGETGRNPRRRLAGQCLPLTMPMTTPQQTGWVSLLNSTMTNNNNSYGDKVRAQMDTESTAAIMGRFYQAVSWRSE